MIGDYFVYILLKSHLDPASHGRADDKSCRGHYFAINNLALDNLQKNESSETHVQECIHVPTHSSYKPLKGALTSLSVSCVNAGLTRSKKTQANSG